MLDLETKFAFAPIMAEDEMGEENMDETPNDMDSEEKKEEGEMGEENMDGGIDETPE